MRIGARVSLFNAKMRELRLAHGLTQAELADLVEVGVAKIGDIEGLKQVDGSYENVHQILWSIADFFDVPMGELFPPDYLYSLQQKYLPKERKLVLFYDVDISSLPAGYAAKQLTENTVAYEQLKIELREAIDNLPGIARDKEILLDFFGFTTGERMKLEDVAKKHGIGRERVRRIIEMQKSHMRHPARARHLSEYLAIDWDALE